MTRPWWVDWPRTARPAQHPNINSCYSHHFPITFQHSGFNVSIPHAPTDGSLSFFQQNGVQLVTIQTATGATKTDADATPNIALYLFCRFQDGRFPLTFVSFVATAHDVVASLKGSGTPIGSLTTGLVRRLTVASDSHAPLNKKYFAVRGALVCYAVCR